MVDRLEHRIEGRATVARINVFAESSAELEQRYRITATPTYLVLDASGAVAYRQVGGSPDTARIEAEINRLAPASR